jgi:hypothetical protein
MICRKEKFKLFREKELAQGTKADNNNIKVFVFDKSNQNFDGRIDFRKLERLKRAEKVLLSGSIFFECGLFLKFFDPWSEGESLLFNTVAHKKGGEKEWSEIERISEKVELARKLKGEYMRIEMI